MRVATCTVSESLMGQQLSVELQNTVFILVRSVFDTHRMAFTEQLFKTRLHIIRFKTKT